MPTGNMASGLIFSFAEMEREAVNMAKIASKFLDDEHGPEQSSIDEWTQQLRNIQTAPTAAPQTVSIPQQRPIRTTWSDGKYEPGGNGRHKVYATISSVWQVTIPASSGPTPKRGTPQSHFAVAGKASTRVSVFACQGNDQPRELARWRFEIGNADSPGCHFHSQILGDDSDAVFPKSMPVPRFPNILFTPMDALEFVLAELFQDEWARHVARETDAIRNWATCQRKRLESLLKWQQETLKNSSGSPWTALKAAKPSAHLLIGAR